MALHPFAARFLRMTAHGYCAGPAIAWVKIWSKNYRAIGDLQGQFVDAPLWASIGSNPPTWLKHCWRSWKVCYPVSRSSFCLRNQSEAASISAQFVWIYSLSATAVIFPGRRNCWINWRRRWTVWRSWARWMCLRSLSWRCWSWMKRSNFFADWSNNFYVICKRMVL